MSAYEQEIESEEPLASESESVNPAAVGAYSINARNKTRCQLQSDIEAFLQRGGRIQQIADNVRADPPRKPSTDYGSAPI